MANKDKMMRGHCTKKCTDKGKGSLALQCDYCLGWVHAECEGISEDNYKMFSSLAAVMPNMSYFCKLKHCKDVSAAVLQQLGPMKTQIDDNTSRIDKIEDKIDKQNHEFKKIVKDEISNIDSAGLTDEKLSDIRGEIKKEVKKEMKEEGEERDDRTSRSKNVIFYNIKESEKDNFTDRKQEDLDVIKRVITKKLEVLDCEIDYVLRLGIFNDEKPRPILVQLKTVSMKWAILKNSSKLKNINKSGPIFVTPDRTKKEREENTKLWNELKRRKDGGEDDLIIKQGKIVKKQLFR